tara:strand:- start:78 stop:650 length:573 start_codon:yes stop_codon:yes gene_type:complete
MKTYKKVLAEKKGVAGLEVLLSIIAMLFMIGIIVMVFVIAGAKLQETVTTGNFLDAYGTVTNESTGGINVSGYTVLGAGNTSASVFAIVTGWYTGEAGGEYAFTNLTIDSNGVVTNSTVTDYGSNATVTYTFSYLKDTSARDVINDTYSSLGDVTDWFPTFIILGALVVLILLVVIIITSIKRSKITEGA